MKNEKEMTTSASIVISCLILCLAIVMYSTLNEKKEKNVKIVPIVQKAKWHEVSASRIGLIGNTTYSGLVIKKDSTFVALPSKFVQKRYVKVLYKRSYIICQVLDLGPWSRHDPYWESGERPKAEQKIADNNINNGVTTNSSAIDLSDGAWDKLGIKRGLGIVKLKWRFIEEQTASDSDITACIND